MEGSSIDMALAIDASIFTSINSMIFSFRRTSGFNFINVINNMEQEEDEKTAHLVYVITKFIKALFKNSFIYNARYA